MSASTGCPPPFLSLLLLRWGQSTASHGEGRIRSKSMVRSRSKPISATSTQPSDMGSKVQWLGPFNEKRGSRQMFESPPSCWRRFVRRDLVVTVCSSLFIVTLFGILFGSKCREQGNHHRRCQGFVREAQVQSQPVAHPQSL